jgi:uncharacterized protein (DUF924 family)
MEWEPVIAFWFGELDERGQAAARYSDRWWRKDPAFDREIRERFAAEHAAVTRREREHWLADPRGAVAYVIVLDQFSRNMFRDTPAMFASDAQALAAARDAIDRGLDRTLPDVMRTFLYMPLMHSEQLADQERSGALFTPIGGANLEFAVRHRDIVARFGRFPHRNAVLGRASTDEEREFLTQPGSSF